MVNNLLYTATAVALFFVFATSDSFKSQAYEAGLEARALLYAITH